MVPNRRGAGEGSDGDILRDLCKRCRFAQEHAGDVHASSTVVDLYGLTCIPRRGECCEFKAGQSFFWEVASGTYGKLARLQAGASETVAAPASLITVEATYALGQKFRRKQAVLSVCGWVAALLHPPPGGALQSLPLRLQQNSTTYFKSTTATLPLSPGPADQVLTRTFGSWTRRGASRLSCARRPPRIGRIDFKGCICGSARHGKYLLPGLSWRARAFGKAESCQ